MMTGEDWRVSVKLHVATIGFYVEFHRKEGHNLGLRLLSLHREPGFAYK